MPAGVREGCHSIQPYLFFQGCAEAIAFYVKAFGGTERLCMKGPEGRVVHAEVVLGDSCVMMADENPIYSAFAPACYSGSPVSLMFYTADCDATYAQALAAGASGLSEPVDQPHGARMGALHDPFGYTWYVATQQVEKTREELDRTA